MKNHRYYQGRSLVVTTTNDDSLHGTVAATSREVLILTGVTLLGEAQISLAGPMHIPTRAITWIQVIEQSQEVER